MRHGRPVGRHAAAMQAMAPSRSVSTNWYFLRHRLPRCKSLNHGWCTFTWQGSRDGRHSWIQKHRGQLSLSSRAASPWSMPPAAIRGSGFAWRRATPTSESICVSPAFSGQCLRHAPRGPAARLDSMRAVTAKCRCLPIGCHAESECGSSMKVREMFKMLKGDGWKPCSAAGSHLLGLRHATTH